MSSNEKSTVVERPAPQSNELLLYVNGVRHLVANPQPEQTLLEYLRSGPVGLTGTKLGCGEGGCGACTVMVSHQVAGSDGRPKVVHRSINACLAPLCSLDACMVTTVEGIGDTRNGLDPIQERLANSHGSQCGFCTPGFVMAAYAYLRANPTATPAELEKSLDGNLCRCTGYRPILDAVRSFGQEPQATKPADAKVQPGICPSSGKPCDCRSKHGYQEPPYSKHVVTREFIFPPELKRLALRELSYEAEGVKWFRPVTLERLLELKHQYPKARLITGNTEVGIETRMKGIHYDVLINPTAVVELTGVTVTDDAVVIGAGTTLSYLQHKLRRLYNSTKDKSKFGFVKAMLDQLHWFAGNQIRNAACVGGNVATASPISDLNPVLVSANAQLSVRSHGAEERVLSMREFFLRYRVTALADDEVIVSIAVPFTTERQAVKAFKQARRRDDDIAIVSACLSVRLAADSNAIETCSFGFGGMAAVTLAATKTEEAVLACGKWDESVLGKACDTMSAEMSLDQSTPGGMSAYRQTLCASFFFKFDLLVKKQLLGADLAKDELSVIDPPARPISRGEQHFVTASNERSPVGKPIVHASALKQVTGEATYVDDIPRGIRTLYAAFVLSNQANAEISTIDASEALKMPGVVAYYDHCNVPGKNVLGPVLHDEELFPTKRVDHMEQPVAMIVADTQLHALRAAKKVVVEYENAKKPIITIADAIEANSFFDIDQVIKTGDPDAAFKSAAHVVEGDMYVSGQEHFYLETQGSLAIPGEDGEMLLWASTQNASETQREVAKILGLPMNRVTCKVKRLGGGFGGKETRSTYVSAAAALAAHHLQVPVNLILDRNVDMVSSGGRHAFYAQYKVGFADNGRLQALDIKIYNNAGYSLDLSLPVLDRACFHIENIYNIPNLKVHGKVCKTNIFTNTAFRGFGGPQSMVICEAYIDHVARTLKMPVDKVREINLYKEGDVTHYGQTLEECHIEPMWKQIRKSSEIDARRAAVDKFNKENRYRKRGLSHIGVKFGMSFTAKFMNQAAAFVSIYTDGSVFVSHGGVEMGQGLHTKMLQCAADALGVPIDKCYIKDTNTELCPNTSPTAASVSSDMNGMAVRNACEKIMERLLPFLKKDGANVPWEKAVEEAYFSRVSLAANGFFRTPDIGYVYEPDGSGRGRPFAYYTYGAAVSEVEVDVLTGDYHTVRTDMLMDCGTSLNPAVDIGQIEGAFIQGVGWLTLEEMVWLRNGTVFTRGPGSYKIPTANDVPLDMRVSLLKDVPNRYAVHSSKGVGEPPYFLAASVFFAIKDAIYAWRDAQNNGEPSPYFKFVGPATCERIRMCCNDPLADRFIKAAEANPVPPEKRWSVTI